MLEGMYENVIHAVLENLPVGLMVISPDGTIREANPASCTILGCPEGGFAGRKWGEVFLPDQENSAFSEVVLDAIQREVPRIQRVTPFRLKNGKERYLSVISAALRDERGKMESIVILVEDLTEIQTLHEREKQILEQNHKLATERAESLTAFADSVAHQIRNPVMAIAGFARILAPRVDENGAEALTAITEEASKLDVMVRAVAEYSALKMSDPVPVNIWVLIEDAKHLIEDHPAVRGKQVTWEADCPDAGVVADRPLLAKALAEALLNAVEFSGEEPHVTISAKAQNANVVITVSDNGPGFGPRALSMAFDPFFTTKPVGAGMGLTRAKRIMAEHQGTMRVADRESGGAEVSLLLPRDHV